MSRAQAESVIKNIIREIAQQCAAQKHALSETLVAFMVKAVVLHPENGFNVDRILTKDDVHKLIKLCVEKLLDTDSPSLETVKMQVYFDMNYTTRSEFLEEHRRVLESRLLPVIREITDSRARTRDELESLYRKIVTAVLLRSGLGSPTDIAVVREATAALQSVFPQSELSTFMSLNKKDKERQILELTMICTGIRLFNKECGKGGEGIDDLPAILNAAVPQTTHNVESLIKETMDYVHKYTAMLEKLYSIKPAEEPPIPVARQALINVRQLLTYLHVILNDIINCAKQVEFLENELSSRLEQLQATVQFKTAVPTAQVYPQFINLSQLWSGLQDEMVLLSVLSNIMASLHPFSKVHKTIFTNEMVTSLLEGVVVKTDEERLGICGPEYCIDAKDFPNLEWLFPEAIKNFHKLQLQYKGYCGWALAKFDRLLLPANPNIGILKYKGFYYIFSSKQAAYEFAANPEYFIQLIGEGAKRSPELIQLLELQAQFSALSPYTQSKDGTCLIEKPITKCDSGTQTDTHFIESNIVKSYEWNEWELRRKAIKLANLRRRVTHSMQTNLSNTKRDSVTQVYPPKEVGMQTKRDSYSNVPKPHTFLAGLRGCGLPNPTVMTKFDLTLDVDQD